MPKGLEKQKVRDVVIASDVSPGVKPSEDYVTSKRAAVMTLRQSKEIVLRSMRSGGMVESDLGKISRSYEGLVSDVDILYQQIEARLAKEAAAAQVLSAEAFLKAIELADDVSELNLEKMALRYRKYLEKRV